MLNKPLFFARDKTGSSVVEFAFVSPILLIMLFAMISFGSILIIESSVQQIAAESARSSVAGLSDSERDSLARSYAASASSSYPLIDAGKLNLTTDTPSNTSFRVLAHYDMSGSFVYRMFNGLPLPDPIMTRTAVVQRGGF